MPRRTKKAANPPDPEISEDLQEALGALEDLNRLFIYELDKMGVPDQFMAAIHERHRRALAKIRLGLLEGPSAGKPPAPQ